MWVWGLDVSVLLDLTFTVYLHSFSYVKVFDSIEKKKMKMCKATLSISVIDQMGR